MATNYEKYLKYKKKYVELKKEENVIRGGAIKFITQTINGVNWHAFVKEINGRSEILRGFSNSFNDLQRATIESFVNYVLPNITINKQPFGIRSISDVIAIGAGSYGVTISCGSLLIKIFKIDSNQESINTIINEFTQTLKIYYATNGSRLSVPNSINQFYGFISGNNKLCIALDALLNKNEIAQKFMAQTQMCLRLDDPYSIDAVSICQLQQHFQRQTQKTCTPLGDNIAFMLMEKADDSFTNFKHYYQTLNNELKLLSVRNFIINMYDALKYIHGIDKTDTKFIPGGPYVHNDIKPDNIVFRLDKDKKDIVFQLIDFGLMTTIIQDKRSSGTPRYFMNTRYEKVTNIEYDWHCVVCSLLEIIGIIEFNSQVNRFIYVNTNVISSIHLNNYDINIYNIMTQLIGPDLKINNTESVNIFYMIAYILNLGFKDLSGNLFNIDELYVLLEKYKVNHAIDVRRKKN